MANESAGGAQWSETPESGAGARAVLGRFVETSAPGSDPRVFQIQTTGTPGASLVKFGDTAVLTGDVLTGTGKVAVVGTVAILM